MDDTTVAEYLDRIHADRPQRPDGAALRELHERHLLAVPFENLSIHLREPIELTEEALFDKIVRRGRGGFCFELNGLFAALLSALGYRVTMMAARVHVSTGLSAPFDHLALRADGDDGSWLVDVGFGRHSRHPLDLGSRDPQPDPNGMFRLVEVDGDLEVVLDDKPQYRLETRPRTLDHFTAMCWWHQTSPKSHFTQSLTCSRETPDGRVTIAGRSLIRTVDGERLETELADDDAVLAAYLEWFGMNFDTAPAVNPR